MSKSPTCAIYVRVSTCRQDPENQLAQLRRYARQRGWRVAEVFRDVESGSVSRRPQFKAMLEAAGRREFDVLLFWSLDRLSREGVGQTYKYLEQLRAAGVAWHDYRNPHASGTGPYADLFISI